MISRDRWAGEVRDVIHSLEAGLRPRPVNLAAITTPALPGEADTADQVAAKNVRWLSDSYRPDLDGMKGHAA